MGLDIQVQHFDVSTSTAPEAASAVGCELGAIVKSLCFIVDGRLVLVLTPGDRRVDAKALRRIFGASKRQTKIADPETVKRLTGFAVGGVPPVGHPQPLTTLIDQSLSRFETVYAAAGSRNSIFAIRYEVLVRISGGQVADVSTEARQERSERRQKNERAARAR
jgi:Cys-tRNA(Pro) deacylase